MRQACDTARLLARTCRSAFRELEGLSNGAPAALVARARAFLHEQGYLLDGERLAARVAAHLVLLRAAGAPPPELAPRALLRAAALELIEEQACEVRAERSPSRSPDRELYRALAHELRTTPSAAREHALSLNRRLQRTRGGRGRWRAGGVAG